jgi:hypothetical protein
MPTPLQSLHPDRVAQSVALSLLSLSASPGYAQSAPSAAPSSSEIVVQPDHRRPAFAASGKTADDAIKLNPFEVNTTKDTIYCALNSTSISAFNMQLLKTPVAADIFTEELMRDVATTTVEDLLNGCRSGVGQSLPSSDDDL